MAGHLPSVLYVEFLAIHGLNLSIKDRWELTPHVKCKNWFVGGGGGKARLGGSWWGVGVMLGKNGQPLGSLPG